MEHPDQRAAAARRPVADPERRRGGAADVPRLRPLPPHRDARHRARRAADPRGRQGRHVVRLVQPRRDALRGPRPLRRHAATPSTRRSAPAAGTSASAPRSRGSSCSILFEETLARYPEMELAGRAASAPSRRSSTSSRRCRCAWIRLGNIDETELVPPVALPCPTMTATAPTSATAAPPAATTTSSIAASSLIASVVVLGAIMSILDTTVVNVAINTLAQRVRHARCRRSSGSRPATRWRSPRSSRSPAGPPTASAPSAST